MKMKIFNVVAIVVLLSGCCTKSCRSNCPCEATYPDEYTRSLKSDHVKALSNLQYQKQVFKNKSTGKMDTITFGELKHNNIVSNGSHCIGPHQTCCNKMYFEQYYVMFNTKTLSIPYYYGLSLDSRGSENYFDSRYMYGLDLPDSTTVINYDNTTFDDCYINLSSNKDTIGLISITKGVLLFTDDRNERWRRIF